MPDTDLGELSKLKHLSVSAWIGLAGKLPVSELQARKEKAIVVVLFLLANIYVLSRNSHLLVPYSSIASCHELVTVD